MSNRYRLAHARRWAVAGALSAVLAATTMYTATTATAEQFLTTSTSVTSSSAWVGQGQPETLTASVRITTVNSLGITPTGTVVFTTTSISGPMTINSAKLGHCVLTVCTATIITKELPAGSDDITAFYLGDKASKPSQGQTEVNVTGVLTGSSRTCPALVVCTAKTPTYTDPNDGTQIIATMTTRPSGQSHTINVALVPNDSFSECNVVFNTDTDLPRVDFGNSSTDAAISLTYDVIGTDAQGMADDFNYYLDQGWTPPMGCFVSTQPFNGWTQGSCDCESQPAPVYAPAGSFLPEGGAVTYYQAPLWPCASTTPTANIPPCYNPPVITTNEANMVTEFKVTIQAPKTDPSYGPR